MLQHPTIWLKYSELWHSCGYVGCWHYFKLLKGLTKHYCTIHPVLPVTSSHQLPGNHQDTDSSSSSTSTDEELANQQSHYGGDFTGVEWDKENFPKVQSTCSESKLSHSPEPDSGIDTEYYGPGDRLYHNYHQMLNSNVPSPLRHQEPH